MATRANTGRTPTRSVRRSVRLLVLSGLSMLLLAAPTVGANEAPTGFVIVVHPENPAGNAPRYFVAQVFLRTVTRWQSGELIRPVDLAPGSTTRAQFSQHVLKRSVLAMRNYWQQRIFSGRDLPPPELDSDAAVVRHVASNRGAIGYVSATAKLDGVRAITLK
jgi:ABC-type phosphate transport system substrate-binding protein